MTIDSEKNYFDYYLEQVGINGKYQVIFCLLFNCFYAALVTAIYYSINISLAVPDHWCHVPGRELTNFSSEEWKEVTIPWQNDAYGEKVFQKCEMYDSQNSNSIIGCKYGWEYDRTWFRKTLSSEFNWVCDKSSYVTDAFTFLTIGDVLGSFVFGQLGDIWGRKPIFLASTVSILIGRILDVFTSNYWILMILFAVGNLPSNSVYQSPVVILMEISETDSVSFITIANQIFYALGYGVMPLVFWAVPDWKTFSLIMTLPLILYLFLYTYMVESPRWLLNRGKTVRCMKEMIKIANVNGKLLPKNMYTNLKNIEPEVEPTYGVMSLFSTPRLAMITTFLLCQGSAHMTIYVLLYLNLNNLNGNPFMNYFWQAIGEIPGHLLAKYTCDRIGRKWTRIMGFLVGIVTNILIMKFITGKNLEIMVSLLLCILKMCLALILYSMNVSILEMYPTALRQTGASLNYGIGCLASLACPFLMYLGTDYGKGFPYMMLAIISSIGFFAGFLLPETLHHDPPETIKETDEFVRSQPIFHFPRRKNSIPFKSVPKKETFLEKGTV